MPNILFLCNRKLNNMFKTNYLLKNTFLGLLTLLSSTFLFAQETSSSIGGIIKSAGGEPLVGATVTALHLPTGTVYRIASRTGGRYDINNMNPGGPYTITVSFVGFTEEKRENIFLSLGQKSNIDIALSDQSGNLTEVVVASRRAASTANGGAETNIGREKITNLPTVSRSLNDYLRVTPQAKITGDGGVSLAGQNNRYNAFYIDGAINNDVFGLAASGTNGGQANINPISIDAIDQFQVVLSPYDASIGGFTGGGINATTKSGTNTLTGSIWTYYRNEDLAGKTPGLVPQGERVKFADFRNLTSGFRVGGPIIKNKLFFFVLTEIQRDERPQPFNFSEYRGTSTLAQLNALRDTLRTKYGYEPGQFLDNPEIVDANRITTKLDWNLNTNHRLSVSYRLNKGERLNTSTSSSNTINYYNNGYAFPNNTNTVTGELRSNFSKGMTNRLLVTYTNVVDDRDPIGNPFPRVSINDGSGRIVFGTENFSTGNLLRQKNLTFNNTFRITRGRHLLSIGTDNLYSDAYNVFIRNLYGNYTFGTLDEFLNNSRPSRYERSFPLVDEGRKVDEDKTAAAASFKMLNLGFFINDEFRVSEKLTLSLGLRADKTTFLDDPRMDPFFNDTAVAAISQYYDLKGARSGQIANVPWSLNPRLGFTYRIREENITLRGGLGLFTGRMPTVWPGGVYNQNGVSIGSINISGGSTPFFNADPFNQYTAESQGINIRNAKGQLDLISEEFKLPKIFRTTLGLDKRIGQGWTMTLEGIYTKNINEIDYQNVNIIPPSLKSVGPDSRNVYSFSGTPSKIPMRPGGINPYNDNIYLLTNSSGDKGFSYNFSAQIDKAFRNNWSLTASYTYGNSVVINEGTSSQNNSQWRFMETVNGRNFIGRSTSDFDLGHRFFAYASKKFSYASQKMATTVTLVYNSQQGQPFSWVYTASMVGDNGRFETNDLIYVPTALELQNMTFLSNSTGGVTYSPAQQKQLLEEFIQGNEYLSKRRGDFAERNGDRLPTQKILDLKIAQDFNIKFGSKTYTIQLSYDIYNFTNFLNRDWGRTYFLTNDNYRLIQFAGYVSSTNLTPQYRFSPQSGDPWNISTSASPGLSARWISQVGARINF